MSYRIHCDWCGEYLPYEADQAVMPVTIKHRNGKSALDAKWAEETKPTRHFCAAPKEDTDRGGRNRMGLVPDAHLDSCYDRALAAIKGTKLGDPAMGMEWRLMPVLEDEPSQPATVAAPAIPAPRDFDPDATVMFGGEHITAGLHEFIVSRVAPSYKFALPRAGVVSLDQVAVMSDNELLEIKGVGRTMVNALRDWIRMSSGYDGLALAAEVYELIAGRLPMLPGDDSMRSMLEQGIRGLGDAIGRPFPADAEYVGS